MDCVGRAGRSDLVVWTRVKDRANRYPLVIRFTSCSTSVYQASTVVSVWLFGLQSSTFEESPCETWTEPPPNFDGSKTTIVANMPFAFSVLSVFRYVKTLRKMYVLDMCLETAWLEVI